MMLDRKGDPGTVQMSLLKTDTDPLKAPIIGLPLHDRIIGAMEGSDDGHTYFFTSRLAHIRLKQE